MTTPPVGRQGLRPASDIAEPVPASAADLLEVMRDRLPGVRVAISTDWLYEDRIPPQERRHLHEMITEELVWLGELLAVDTEVDGG